MSLSLNQVVVSGKIFRDSESHTFKNGGAIISFTIGYLVSKWKGDDGKWQYKNGFADIKRSFPKDAEFDWLLEKAVKGTHVAIVGKLGFEEWGEGDGKRSKITVVADSIQFLDAPSGSEGSGDDRNRGGNRRGGGKSNNRSNDRGRNSRQYDARDPDEDGGREDIPF